MTLQQLKYFVAVVKAKSLSRAAESLFVSQPALSKQIALLERSLNVMLFERNARGVRLTEKGQRFYERVAPLLQELQDAYRETAEPTELKIGALPSIASYFLPTWMLEITTHHLIPVIKDTSDELLDMVQSGELDAAIVQDREQVGDVKELFLFEEPYLVAVHVEHHFATRDTIDVQDLAQENLLFHQAPCDIRVGVLQMLEQVSLSPQIALEVSHNDSLLGFTAAGVGLSFVPAMVAEHVVHKNIVFKPITPACTRRISLVAKNLHPFERNDKNYTFV